MEELIRDTPFGHALRLISKNQILQWEEEKDSSLWKQYVNEKASGNLAHHGTTEKAESDDGSGSEEQHPIEGIRTREAHDNVDPSSSDSSERMGKADDGEAMNVPSGVKVDPEKGRDAWVIDWWGPNDPEVPAIQLHDIPVFLTSVCRTQ